MFGSIPGLPHYVVRSLEEDGVARMTTIQRRAVQRIMRGQDFVGVAPTGSGKTLAFLVPAIVHLEAADRGVVASTTSSVAPLVLVLTPTRELAIQIESEATKLLRRSASGRHDGGLRAVAVYGGTERARQLRWAGSGCHIMVATVGRLMDFVQSREVSLRRAGILVLDEADKMLEDGFLDDVGSLARELPAHRQSVFFSATWPPHAAGLIQSLAVGAAAQRIAVVNVAQSGSARPRVRAGITQRVVVFDEPNEGRRAEQKTSALVRHCQEALRRPESRMLVFVSTRAQASGLRDAMRLNGCDAAASMHGGDKQETRTWIVDRFRAGEVRLLVTTDVLSRGLDIGVTHVVVYDYFDATDYVHRIGRTARGPHGHGQALVFFDLAESSPQMAQDLIAILEESGEEVPRALREGAGPRQH